MAAPQTEQPRVRPSKLGHIVLRSNNLNKLRDFYLQFLGATIAFEAPDKMAFLRYDDEHHRLGIFNMPDIQDKVVSSSGLEHIAFGYNSLSDLITAYKERKALNFVPYWNVNHGPTISMYYRDTDGNILENFVDTMSVSEADAFIMSESYRINPIGVDFDPEELLAKSEAGEDLTQFVKRKEIGPRDPTTVPGYLDE